MRTYLPNQKKQRSLLAGRLLLALLFVAGCSGSRVPTETDLARQYLPPVRQVHHPDSLVHLDISYKGSKATLKLERSLGQLWRGWSAGHQVIQGGRFFETQDYETFATLESLELALAWLDYEKGVSSLTRALAERLIQEEREQYRRFLTFEVYVFISERYASAFSGTALDAPGVRVRLRDDQGHEYQPAQVASSRPVRTAERSGVSGAFHRVNVIAFEREVEGRDILEGVRRLELSVRTSQPVSSQLVFAWEVEAQ